MQYHIVPFRKFGLELYAVVYVDAKGRGTLVTTTCSRGGAVTAVQRLKGLRKSA